MAEDEIRKHTKKVYNTLVDKEKSWKHKLKDILVEILIIVFAVSVSIWFHNQSDKWQEHKQEKEFLSELKEDLQQDTANMQNSLQFYKFSLQATEYFMKVGAGDTLSNDSMNKYSQLFFSNTELEPHKSHYEALKGSGKFDIIEDKKLLNNIIEIHESVFADIEMLNNFYIQYIQRLASFLQENAKLTTAGQIQNGQELLRSSQMRLLLTYGKSSIVGNIIPTHLYGIKKCNQLSQQIDAFMH